VKVKPTATVQFPIPILIRTCSTSVNAAVDDFNLPRCVAHPPLQRPRCLVNLGRVGDPVLRAALPVPAPTLYVLNAAALTKPHAIEHLAADLAGYCIDVAVISETHLKQKHYDHNFAIDGYSMFRHDRVGRRGGGVAVYVSRRLIADVWEHPGGKSTFELLWVCVQLHQRHFVIGALYHPPKPSYNTGELIEYIEASVDAIAKAFPDAMIVLAGDFNALDDATLTSRTVLNNIVTCPTRGDNMLDRIYVNDLCYATVRVVTSTVKSDHKAVVATTSQQVQLLNKTRQKRRFRKHTPTQHAQFLEYAASLHIEFTSYIDVQSKFDHLYQLMNELLDRFYPEREITVTSTDQHFVTSAVKAMLRRKNRLMRAGRVEEAGAIAKRVRAVITQKNSALLNTCDTRKRCKETWEKVREVTRGHRRYCEYPHGVTAQTLNTHYAAISTDHLYSDTRRKLTANSDEDYVTEMGVFGMLDTLKPTAAGLDAIPAWFLRVGAPVFAAPLAELFNESIAAGIVPRQWKTAVITPVPKVSTPACESDYRPISITPIMSRLLERQIVKNYIYPALQSPPPDLNFDDQFAFRPTGSTTAALVTLLNSVTDKLTSNDYVRVFALDFTKAFDTVRHSSLMHKIAKTNLPDAVYNWIKDFFDSRMHCTKFRGEVSASAEILASVVQGSGLGPAAYIVNAADLRPIHPGNDLVKYADDTYLVISAVNNHTCVDELQRVQAWAKENNLRLNASKCKEMTFQSPRARARKSQQLPPLCLDIERVQQMTVLGVVINDRLSASDHVTYLITSCARLLYALRVLRAHGLPQQSLMDVYRATVQGKLLYAASAWSGFCTAGDRMRLNSFLRRCWKLGYSNRSIAFEDMCAEADEQLFDRLINNTNHVLHRLLPPPTTASQHYNLRSRTHTLQLPEHSTRLSDSNFLVRMLYRDCY